MEFGVVLQSYLFFLQIPLPLLFYHLPHGVDALALLLQIGMYIEIQRCTDVRVAKEYADRLVIAFALYAAGCETMPETVETHLGKSQ